MYLPNTKGYYLGFQVVRILTEPPRLPRKNSIGMKLNLLPAGEFMIGEGGDAHRMTLIQAFEMGGHEVTQEQYKHCNVPQPYRENEALGNWLLTQRKDWKNGTLSDDRIKRLEELGVRWQHEGNVI